MLSLFAPAKVNLFLHVTGKREDGYHLLDSLAVFPAVGDQVRVAEAAALSLEISGPFGAVLRAEADNLLLRAARLLAPTRGAALHLEKNLPVASGIGGGSADAAAALRALSQLWNMQADLPALALRLGADVPVCLTSRPTRMQGIGEILAPAPRLPGFGMVLVNPGVAVPTPAVFKARQGGFSPLAELPEAWASVDAMVADLARCTNDLQTAAIGIQPVIGEVLATLSALPGAKLARMSGSGATCFAIFATPAEAAAAAAAITNPGWWRWGGGLYEPPQPDL
ncbi:4-(cytidine 5'-diphospho)-2-C-methyl-D-erythritol kinase [Acidocella sp. KAb 2-4]|uniref:4-(cytidine 5'-diphospho)-2-C-methyl-D-erythritol kinase n=1 Tax=Acidocella sp. KAb 2-4 TaxID=2885158 RepID=UPI001D06FDFB|nr:4-(cytidine 5'-diphospho)-2-C-methyl-D-erythritol kinase [Acidocella sp. KAb 2-4]MCB5945876.1 4-(cytidine 5'-diphospho)-2-C-methyl-D-erythritol kinase [Acidocella sp. KAb 2-4]